MPIDDFDYDTRMEALLDCLCAQGACAINIIPDRNYNLTDPSDHVRIRLFSRFRPQSAVGNRMSRVVPLHVIRSETCLR